MKKFCLVGKDIAYSLSPIIHKQIYEYLEVDASYDLQDVSLNELPQIIRQYDGLNVTKPYKIEIGRLLDDAKTVSVNTIIKRNGKTIGFSTDGNGFLSAFKKTIENNYSQVAVVGGGGASMAVAKALVDNNFETFIYARNSQQADYICSQTGAKLGNRDFAPNAVIYAASGGQYLPFDNSNIQYLMDLRYDGSEIKTDKFKVVNGITMLIQQAILSATYFLDKKLDQKQIDEIFFIIYNNLCKR